MDKCALVITSSVHVSAPYTSLIDAGQRQQQYMDAISFFITQSPFIKIIVCDNSGHHYPSSLTTLAQSHKKEIELLCFTGNNDLVAKYGKGYGEGQIMEFVLLHSNLIKQVEGFFKVTGRLKVVNADAVLKHCHAQQNYFMPISLLRPRFMVPKAARPCVEVRVYYSTVPFFKEVLLKAYNQVRDKNTYFLEHAYHDAMVKHDRQVKCFPVAPEITGMSGSNGWVFSRRSYPKRVLIRFVSLLGYIYPIYKRKRK
jgi:hypothetical protein